MFCKQAKYLAQILMHITNYANFVSKSRCIKEGLQSLLIERAFTKLRNVTISLVMSVHVSDGATWFKRGRSFVKFDT
jgi:hypothetical protein